MAARKRRGTKDNPWPQQVKDRIAASMLEKRLLKHIDNDENENPPVMSPSQITAATVLLRKVLPDMQASTVDANMKHSGLDTKAEKPDTTKVQALAASFAPSQGSTEPTTH